MNNGLEFVLSLGIILVFLIGISYNESNATSLIGEKEKIPLYYVSTRDILSITYENVTGPVGYQNETYQNLSKLTCQNETVIFVHGWEETEDNVKERLNRVKLSLEKNGYIHPLIGFQLAL